MTRGKQSKHDYNDIVNGIIQLKKEFKSGSFLFKQVYHANGWYIYQLAPSNFEVFIEKTTPMLYIEDGKMKTDKSMLKVKYPNDEDFGTWAWSVNSYDRALEIIKYNI